MREGEKREREDEGRRKGKRKLSSHGGKETEKEMLKEDGRIKEGRKHRGKERMKEVDSR